MIKKIQIFLVIYFVLIVGWWAVINVQGQLNADPGYYYGVAYALIALIGSLVGFFVVARKFGGFKSSIGKAVSFLSLGLFGLAFGQLVWSYYNLIAQVEVPYPSIADFGYISIIPFYGTAMFLLAKVGGAKFTIKKLSNKLVAFFIPLAFLIVSYTMFLSGGYVLDLSNPLRVFLDFGQPFGQAMVISVAIITWQLSRTLLGGVMRRKIFFILAALVLHYIADFSFYYQNSLDLYQNGGIVDLLYTISFTAMALALLNMANITQRASVQVVAPLPQDTSTTIAPTMPASDSTTGGQNV